MAQTGEELLEAEEWEQALAWFERKLEAMADDVDDAEQSRLLVGRGRALYGLKRLSEAKSLYDEAVRLAPEYAEAHYRLGLTLRRLAQDERAMKEFDRAIKLNDSVARFYLDRGVSHVEAGRHAEGVDDYNRAIELDPTWWMPRYNRGIRRMLARNTLGALDDFEVVIAQDDYDRDFHSDLYKNLSIVAQRHPKRALEVYATAAEFEPDNPEAHLGRARALVDLMRYPEAHEALQRALDLNPTHIGARYGFASLLNRMGRFEESIEAWDWLMENAPLVHDSWKLDRGIAVGNLEARRARETESAMEDSPPDAPHRASSLGAYTLDLPEVGEWADVSLDDLDADDLRQLVELLRARLDLVVRILEGVPEQAEYLEGRGDRLSFSQEMVRFGESLTPAVEEVEPPLWFRRNKCD